jgi:peptide-methionine (R)-S-oxide reductase
MRLTIHFLLTLNVVLFCQSNPNRDINMNPKNKTDKEWQSCLSPKEYNILRQKGTEPPGTGKYYKHNEDGIYHCAGCAAPLFSSDTKYDSGSGWPSFWAPAERDALIEENDFSLFMKRIEIQCSNCGGHLGHVFDDGPQPTGLRYCVNSTSLKFQKSLNSEK